MNTGERWTAEEVEHLRRLAGTMRAKDVAALLGRSHGAVRIQLRRLRIKGFLRGRGPRWTAEEIKRLRCLAGTMPAWEIATELHRTIGGVQSQMTELQIKGIQRGQFPCRTVVSAPAPIVTEEERDARKIERETWRIDRMTALSARIEQLRQHIGKAA